VRNGRAVRAKRYAAYTENRLYVDVHQGPGASTKSAGHHVAPASDDLIAVVAAAPNGDDRTPSSMYHASLD
jgi:hypothetical protein